MCAGEIAEGVRADYLVTQMLALDHAASLTAMRGGERPGCRARCGKPASSGANGGAWKLLRTARSRSWLRNDYRATTASPLETDRIEPRGGWPAVLRISSTLSVRSCQAPVFSIQIDQSK